MQDNAVMAARRLLPRWRPLARTPAYEISAGRVGDRKERRKSVYLESALARWTETRSLVDAAEVIDAALISGHYTTAAPAALEILKGGHGVSGLNSAARQILGEVSDRPSAELSSAEERVADNVHKQIALLKRRLVDAPRDALSALEVARLQSLIGQSHAAEKYIERAVKLAPNDRYILRSAARFWAHRSKSGDDRAVRALEMIWASDVVRVDPWVQAAEVAVASICGKIPRWGVKAEKGLIQSEPNRIEYSELAGGLATFELREGAPIKKIRKLLRISLRAPTENSLAQAVWARGETGIDFDVYDYLRKIPNANEAWTRAKYEAGDYRESARGCWYWLEDESFSARAALAGAFVNFCLLGQYETALAFADLGLRANPDEPMLWNDKLIALAYLGRLKEAEMVLPHLEAFGGDRYFKPYVYAARGLLAFRAGDYVRGRELYTRTVEYCHGLSRPRLVANASIFWLEQELLARTIDAGEASQVISKLDEFYNRKENGSGKSPVWNVRKKNVILQILDGNAKQEALLAKSREMRTLLLAE